jgi:hypothetical protein
MIHSTKCLGGARAGNPVREERVRPNSNVTIRRSGSEWVSNLEKRRMLEALKIKVKKDLDTYEADIAVGRSKVT